MDTNDIVHAVEAVRKGKLIVYPTDTLYALGANVSQKKAITAIFQLKQRPKSLPLPVAVSDKHMLSKVAILSPLAKKLAHTFFPGKITLVCRKKQDIPSIVTAGKDTIAVRIPDDQIALTLLKKTGPLVATSANIHKMKPAATVSEIRKLFKPEIVEVYIDDGIRQGKPSTIVDVTESQPVILREGSISKKMILELE
ncbi:MAG: threonylcarbamoyl-AMP synthase [Candidatus Thermoplasmatota archaeon]|nr:threonylcarbamoyl-AMP synthase [Candidatus Thermoplasmatota archaeon]